MMIEEYFKDLIVEGFKQALIALFEEMDDDAFFNFGEAYMELENAFESKRLKTPRDEDNNIPEDIDDQLTEEFIADLAPIKAKFLKDLLEQVD